ncbi:hypothetical protein [Borreliella kurtenbachii]|uniref:hypothetical protein n=1 Tax=Borreliella kurtenbachii TaxID=1196056 RepID=UPI003462CB17
MFKDLIKENLKIAFRKFINTKYSKKVYEKVLEGPVSIDKIKEIGLEEYKDSQKRIYQA